MLLPACEEVNDLLGVSDQEIVAGLKEALEVGTENSSDTLGRTDGYFRNELVKILLPPEAQAAEARIRNLPIADGILDDLVLEMNRAAEEAAKDVTPIFVDAITEMTIQDGMNILQGDSTAATTYLRQQTYTELRELYRPKIQSAMESVGASQTWNTIAVNYNAGAAVVPGTEPLPEDISRYVTEEALDGLFLIIGQEEQKIREDPAARVTDLLERVFAIQD